MIFVYALELIIASFVIPPMTWGDVTWTLTLWLWFAFCTWLITRVIRWAV